MKRLIFNTWDSIMNYEHNPLRHIPDLNTRHMVMQVLAWMWCIVFSMYFGSMWVFGITAIAHVFIICAIVLTVATFETAKRKPTFFLKKGFLKSIGLDVLPNDSGWNFNSYDSLKENKLYKSLIKEPNVYLTPHVGGYAKEAIYSTREFILEKVMRFIGINL